MINQQYRIEADLFGATRLSYEPHNRSLPGKSHPKSHGACCHRESPCVGESETSRQNYWLVNLVAAHGGIPHRGAEDRLNREGLGQRAQNDPHGTTASMETRLSEHLRAMSTRVSRVHAAAKQVMVVWICLATTDSIVVTLTAFETFCLNTSHCFHRCVV
jgi:hypothetical protein